MPAGNEPKTPLDSATGNIAAIIENERVLRAKLSLTERWIYHITRFCGSLGFVWFHFIWFGLWIAANTLMPHKFDWDPYPFTFLTLVVSLEAIFLSTFILISERREAAVTERRLHLDLQINLLAEAENTQMLNLLQKIAHKLKVDDKPDAELSTLLEKTDPSKILEEIDECLKEPAPSKPSP